MFIPPSSHVHGFMMWTFCLLQYVIFQLITETPRVKNVTQRCISPPLCDQVAPPTMLFSLHAIHPSIHPPCQCPLPVSSSPPISWPHHLSIILLLLHVEALLFPLCASYFPSILPTNSLVLSLNLCQSLSLFSLLSHSFILPYLLLSLLSILPPNPPFLFQSAVTGSVGEGLAVSMSSHFQQW